jgi:hypothetical protein
MIVDRGVDVPQLIRDHLKTLTVSRDIGKILHASVRKLLLKSDNTSVLIVLKNVTQMILYFHNSGVWFQNSGQHVSENCGTYPLKDSGVEVGPLFILNTRGICQWCFVLRGNNMV